MPGAPSRWNAKKDLSWVPLRPELVAEVAYETRPERSLPPRGPARRASDHDRDPASCTFAQLEQVAPYELREIFGT